MILGDVLALHDRLTAWTGAAIPVPVRVADVGEFDALLLNEAPTEARPLVWGVNVTEKFALCPAGIVTGRPLTTNSELPTLTEETVTLAPAAVSVPV
jgi:hypothetical protein